ncbi:hypothetical protein BST28_20495 [Mycolicibacter kumamotonensis]|uniref:TniQ domain-containing protein n=1 Tax=Mycolicibacter kumamotonensis TaxID=354243 RepID=A0A1X0DWG7_9MYCO|nr:hypothetical protein BST28_20495 [Mycolicibacter kumamotonensis]
MPGIRSLPMRVAPAEDESLDSWLEVLAARLDARWGELVAGVGVLSRPGEGAAQQLARAAVAPTELQIALISRATGVDPVRVEATTLAPWIAAHVSRQRSATMRVPGSRFCPLCLDERGGRWRVWWRLRWAFACLTHCCLLEDRCADCGGLQRLGPRPPGDKPVVGRCTSYLSSNRAGRCSAPLARNSVRLMGHDDPLFAAQRAILSVMRERRACGGIYTDQPVRSEVFSQDLRLLGTWILRVAHRHELGSRISDALARTYTSGAGTHPLVTSPTAGRRGSSSRVSSDAVAACVAVPVLSAADPAAAAEQLRWLTTSMRRRGLSPHTPAHRWRPGVSTALTAVAQHLASAK